MGSSIRKAIELILSADPELLTILSTTGRVCLTSSILALLIGVPLGILLGAERFPGRKVPLVLNRTLMKRYELLILDEQPGGFWSFSANNRQRKHFGFPSSYNHSI